MRIGLVYDDSLDGTDGVPQYVLHVGEWLRRNGHAVFYLVGETHRTDLAGVYSLSRNMHVRFNGNSLSTPLPANKQRLRDTLTELKLDILHIQTPYSPYMAGRLIRYAGSQTGIVGTFHILPYSAFVRALSIVPRLLNAASARKFDAMMAVSAPAQTFAKTHYGFASSVVPNCFDLERFSAVRNDISGKQIVFLGRLVPRKGPLELLRAVALIVNRKEWPADWRVRIGGKGELASTLQSYIAEHKLAAVVTLDGFIDESNKAMFLAQADIAVFPSIAGESFGISLLEGFAAARGVVLGGDNPGYRSVMDGFEDQLVDPRDTKALAELLVFWMAADSKRTIVAKKQQAYVARFDTDVVGKQILRVYEAALQKHRKAWHN